MTSNKVRVDDCTPWFIGCCTVHIVRRDVVAHVLLWRHRGRISVRAAVAHLIRIRIVAGVVVGRGREDTARLKSISALEQRRGRGHSPIVVVMQLIAAGWDLCVKH